MARDVFHMTIALPVREPDLNVDLLRPLSGVRVSVFERGTTNPVQIFQRPTGAAEGPTPEAGATGGPNPFTTGATGNAEFWCDGPKELDVFIEDTQAPARLTSRTYGWNVMPVANGSLPTDILADDGNLTLGNMGPDVQRQWTQIGQVIDWWRPDDSVPTPSGFEVCDGHQIPAGQHDFPGLGTSAINLPDLRNQFIIGADPAKARGTGANMGNAPTDGPGIAGSGGSNAAKNFGHSHVVAMPSHVHTVTVPDHAHAAGSLYAGSHAHGVNINTSAPINGTGTRATGNFTGVSDGHQHNVAGATAASGSVGVGGSTAGSGGLAASVSGPNVAQNANTGAITWTQDPGGAGLVVDVRPQFVGLLKLMKVRRS